MRGRGLLRRGAVALVAALSMAATAVAVSPSAVVHAAPAFVQARAQEVTSGTTDALAFTNPNTAGNLIVAYVVWSNGSTVTLSDSRGNTYAPAQAVTKWKGNAWSSQVFYAKNIGGGANTVTAKFSSAINSFGIVY